MMENDLRHLRSILFVPGNRPDRYGKALNSGADAICIDLEDAVAPDGKDEAREAAMNFVASSGKHDTAVIVRINAAGTPFVLADLTALRKIKNLEGLAGIMLPKASVLAMKMVTDTLAERSREIPRIALIEDPAGLHSAFQLAAEPNVAALAFGAYDFAAVLGCDVEHEFLNQARFRLRCAAAPAGISSIDSPSIAIDDADTLSKRCEYAAHAGFDGMLAIHPRQVETINRVFTPTPEEVAEAQKICDALKQANGGVAVFDGKMIDAPIVASARKVLARAARFS